jgi:hypothetical protein
MREGSRIVPPLRLVEIDRKKVAAVVLKQGIHADGVLPGQMAINNCIGERE